MQAIVLFLARIAWVAVAHGVGVTVGGVAPVAALWEDLRQCHCQLMATGRAGHVLYASGNQRTPLALGVRP